MVNSIDYGLERNASIVINPYLVPVDKPGLQRLYTLDEELYRILRGIVAYSVKVVNLSTSSKTDKQQVEAFADYIEKLDKPTLEFHIKQGNVTEQDFSDVLNNIRKQEDLLGAMQAAQPMIEFVLQHVESLADEIKQQEHKAANEISMAIDKTYASEIAYVDMLLARRKITLDALVSIDKFYMKNNTELQSLNQSKVLQRLGLKVRTISATNLKQVERDLKNELVDIQSQLDLIEKDENYYMKIHGELDKLVAFHDEEVRKAKGFIQLWANAHTKMANGITDPADWFDISDPGGEFIGIMRSVIIR